jgi:hypothetical protein
MFGRSKSAAQAAVRRYQGKKPRTSYNCGTGPAIGLEQTEMGFRRDCYQGSLSLQRAIESLFARMPERRVMAILCPAPARIPGTERIYRGQGAERALAA